MPKPQHLPRPSKEERGLDELKKALLQLERETLQQKAEKLREKVATNEAIARNQSFTLFSSQRAAIAKNEFVFVPAEATQNQSTNRNRLFVAVTSVTSAITAPFQWMFGSKKN